MLVHEFNHAAAATCNTGQWVVGNDHRQAGFFHQQLVEITQHCATAGQYDAAFGDIGTQFRRRLLQGFLDGTDDALQRFLQRFENFVAVQREAAWYTFGQIAALYRNLLTSCPG